MTAQQDHEATPLLRANGISKFYGGVAALQDVDFEVRHGRIHCLLGENGAGKSTLCKIIYGEETQDGGTLHIGGKAYLPLSPADALAAGFAMVHQHFSLINNMTACENLMVGNVSGRLDYADFSRRMQDLSERYGLGVELSRRVSELSIGQQQRVEILKCLMRNPRLLILDEPTAVLLPDEIDALLAVCRQIAEQGHSVVLVTHKLAEIARVADEITVLRTGKRVMHSAFTPEKVDSFIAAMMGSELKESSLQLSRLRPDKTGGDDVTAPEQAARGSTARGSMVLDGITYTDPKGELRLDNITMVIESGEIVGLAGVEGNGQTELGDIIAGLIDPNSGRMYLPDADLTQASPATITAAGVGIVPEDRHRVACIQDMSLAENLLLPTIKQYRRFGLLDRTAMRAAARKLMAQFDVRTSSADNTFRSLSGGNQQKAVLARELSLRPLHFLLAAQPTRGLDIGAVFSIYQQICDAARRGVGVLLISSELDDMMSVCDRIAVIYRGRIVGSLPAQAQHREQIGAWMAGQVA